MKSTIVIFFVGFILTYSSLSYSFKPNYSLGAGSIVDAEHNHPQNHSGITGEALSKKFVLPSGEYSFNPDVITEIKKRNACVDLGSSFEVYDCGNTGEFGTPEAHCDGERIFECFTRITNLKDAIVDDIVAGKYDDARAKTGRALHTLQDFYAHSNWANIFANKHISVVYPENTMDSSIYSPNLRVDDTKGAETCLWVRDLANAYLGKKPKEPAEFGSIGKNYITTGYFEGYTGISDPEFYGKCAHGSKNTGINKDYPSAKGFLSAVDGASEASKHFIDSLIQDALLQETTGGKSIEQKVREFMGDKPEVNIGFVVDTTGSMSDTIAGVKAAISGVVDEIKTGNKSVTHFLSMSYGDPGIGAVITVDNADAMKAAVNQISLGSPDYGGDCPERTMAAVREMVAQAPNNTELYVYTDASSKQPELADALISEATNKSITLHFFVSGNCSESGTDINYQNIASATGGNVSEYEHSTSGAEGTFSQINPQFKGNLQASNKIQSTLPAVANVASGLLQANVKNASMQISALEQARIKMEPYTAADGNKTYHIVPKAKSLATNPGKLAVSLDVAADTAMADHQIKVDGFTSGLLVAVDMPSLGLIELYRPDGTKVLVDDLGVTINSSSVGTTFNIDKPVSGNWKLHIAGAAGAAYGVDVKTNSDIRIISFDFTETKGREGHEGNFPIPGLPPIGEEQPFRVVMGGGVKTAELVIMSLDGKELAVSTLDMDSADTDEKNFSGVISLTTQDFRVHIRGKDSSGKDYDRMYPKSYRGQSVRVDALVGEYVSTGGRPIKANFKIQNLGASDQFILTATNTRNYPVTLSATEISLEADEVKEIAVEIPVPTGIPAGTVFGVTMQAKSKSNADSYNTAATSFIVDADTDGDGVSDNAEQRGVEKNTAYDGNKDGITDWKQANVASVFANDGSYITLEVSNGALSKARIVSDFSNGLEKPDKASFPLGYFDFSIVGLTKGQESTLKVFYPTYVKPSKYYKYTADASSAWSEFDKVTIEPGLAAISLMDGQAGDDDAIQNGKIEGDGGLGIVPSGPQLLKVSASPGGKVLSKPVGVSCTNFCSKAFRLGSTVKLKAKPNKGYRFSGWSGGCQGLSTCNVLMDAANSVKAKFTPLYKLKLNVVGKGRIQAVVDSQQKDCKKNCKERYLLGSNVTLNPIPAAGYTFVGWAGSCSGTDTCIVTIIAEAKVEALFAKTP